MGLFLPKIEAALDSRSKGYKTTIEIPMEEAYGDYDEELVEELTKADFADFEDIYEGMEFVVELEDGSEMVAVITEIDGDKVYTDSNHPFSGRNLLFEVEVTDVREATDEELDHGHVHEYENEE
jgi:peptidyl-prolyl cis-trans isomerase